MLVPDDELARRTTVVNGHGHVYGHARAIPIEDTPWRTAGKYTYVKPLTWNGSTRAQREKTTFQASADRVKSRVPFETPSASVGLVYASGHGESPSTFVEPVDLAREHALAESRSRLDYAVRLSRIGFWYGDLPFDELSWDEQVKEHFFLPAAARVTINTFYERIHPDDREATRAAIAASIASRDSYDVVYRTVDARSGEIKYIRALGGTAYGPDGAPRRFDGITVDVTAHKLDQERLAQGLEREREHARLLRQVADAALDIHASDSLERVLAKVTERARQLTGAHRAHHSDPRKRRPARCQRVVEQ